MKFTPEAATLTTASLGLGCGTGISTISRASGPPGFFTWMALMCAWINLGPGRIQVKDTSAGAPRQAHTNVCCEHPARRNRHRCCQHERGARAYGWPRMGASKRTTGVAMKTLGVIGG